MVDLKALSPLQEMTPVTIGGVTLKEVAPGRMTTIAPYRGKSRQASEALKAAHGLAMPEANRSLASGEVRVIWFGRDMALLLGPAPDAGLAAHAALTDQSDAWAVVTLEGRGAADVLARLCPLDLRAGVFQQNQTARTELQHMLASITCLEDGRYLIMVFRSMAQTLIHDLKTAMEAVAARD